ncbi:MAG: peptidoglycan DD-metalloendopeptidase family protein [Bacteroidales bacterium]|nr:peptidoglycan DD-metalloendopeptidase family protein [Bacteroidales bacterium]
MNQLSVFHPYRWLLLLPFVLFLSEAGVYAQSRQNLEQQRKQALQDIEETNSYLKETQQSQKESLEKLNLLSAQVTQFNRLINSINAEIAYANRQIGETSAKVGGMSIEIEKMKAEYAQLVYHTYKNRGKYNKLIYVLSAKDFNEAYRRMKYFQQYSEYRKRQVAEITVKQEELRVVIEQLAVRKAEKEKLLAEQRQESKRLEAVKAEQNKEVNSLKAQERKLRSQLEAQKRKAQKLQNDIGKIIAAEAKKRKTTTDNLYDKLTPDERLVSNNFKGNKGRLPWPTEKGIITGYFGINAHPFFKEVRMINNGIDITTIGSADVRAVFDGEVTGVGGIPGDNLFIMVRHGNYITVYQNLVDVAVKQGDKVKHKENIGKVYTEKGAKTAVLHFEIWEGTNKLDPELWMMKN